MCQRLRQELGAFGFDPRIGGFGRIFVMNANGSGHTQLTFGPGDDFGPASSPDGAQIAFVRNVGHGDRPVFLTNADGTDQRPLTGHGALQFVPGWQPRGERLVP